MHERVIHLPVRKWARHTLAEVKRAHESVYKMGYALHRLHAEQLVPSSMKCPNLVRCKSVLRIIMSFSSLHRLYFEFEQKCAVGMRIATWEQLHIGLLLLNKRLITFYVLNSTHSLGVSQGV